MAHLGCGLADAGKHDPVRRDTCGTGAAVFAFGHDIHPRACVAQQLEDGDVAGGLDGIADQMRTPGQRLVEQTEMPQQGRGGIDVGRRADSARNLGQGDIFGVKYAVAIQEMIHQRLRKNR